MSIPSLTAIKYPAGPGKDTPITFSAAKAVAPSTKHKAPNNNFFILLLLNSYIETYFFLKLPNPTAASIIIPLKTY